MNAKTVDCSRPDAMRRTVVVVAVAAVLVLLLGPCASPSLASEHTEVTGEYGKEGPASTGIGGGCHLAYNSAAGDLYLASDGRIYGLAVTPGTATPLGGNFPVSAGISTGCGDPDMEVDNSGSGNIYAVQSGGQIYGWHANGTPLGAPWPITVPGEGETCGVDVAANGEVWGGNYSQRKIFKFTAAGTANGSISVGFSFCKFAIDRADGDIFVAPYDGGEIVKFTAESGYTTQVKFPASGSGDPGLAVNGAEHKLYVGNNNSSTVKVYDTETGGLVEEVNLGAAGGGGIAVDEGTDTLFVSVGSGSTGVIKEYLGLTTPKATTGEPIGNSEVSGTANPNGVGPITECYFEYGLTTAYGSRQNCAQSTPISSEETVTANLPGLTGEETYHYRLVLTNGQPHVIGRGGDKTIIPHNVKGLFTEAATEITQESATLNASFEGTNEDTHYYFEWGQSTQYGHRTATPPGEDAGATTGHTTISSPIAGLSPGVTYHYRAVAENSIGISKAQDKTFKTYELPSIESFTTKNISAHAAEVDANINPHGFETEYFVEYGPSVSYGSIAPVPNGTLPAGATSQAVAVQLTGLQGVTYHFRVVAINRWGTTRTGDQTFNFFPPPCPNATIRQQTGSQYLPDCRAYELVSPGEAGGVTLRNASWAPDPLATNPARFAFGGELGALPGANASNSLSVDTYIATRTANGWESHYVGVPGSMALGDSSPLPNQTFTRFFNFLEGAGFEGVKQPLNNIPYIWDAEGNLVERWPANFESVQGALEAEGAWQPSPDFSHLAFSTRNAVFAEGGQTTVPGSAYDYNVATHSTQLISLTANGTPIPQQPGNAASTHEFIQFPGNRLDFNNETNEARKGHPAVAGPAVSTNGSHILMSTSSAPVGFFTHPTPPTVLYMRVNDAVTYEVSQGHAVNYVGMTADGKEVFFTSQERLTPEDTDSSVDLYMWSEAGNTLTLISKGPEGTNNAGNSDACAASWTTNCNIVPVQGTAATDNAIAAESGEIYFYSPEQLEGSKGIPNQENLYVYREGRPRFVATLSPITLPEGHTGPISRIQVSPNGEHAAFLTRSRLTSYQNNGLEEMYTYEPASGKILCASCIPNGEPPHADVTASKAGLFMANDGRTFFQTTDALVSQDTNQGTDVYEYVEGRPQLITSGTGTRGSAGGLGSNGNIGEEGLAGVSANGVNVYFSAREELVAQDKNGAFLTFYDARTGGGFSYEPPLAPCEAADECHGEGSSAPPPPSISSAARLGEGGNAPNPKQKKQKKKKHKGKKQNPKQKKSKKSTHRVNHGKGGNHA
ncbi:MAG: hypothetical protein JSU06_01295 [Actinobacteria bacterium]|nr:hypothetical protein [Actinomycetota bacterium]